MQTPETEIIVTKDGTEILRKTVPPGDYVIGREPDCDVHVDLELVSRRHAQLTVNYDHALIEDLGSTHGTFVAGRRVSESTRLWPNQKIEIGSAVVELHRVKTVPPPDVSLAPQTAAVQRLLPEEFLHEKKYAIGKVVAQGGMGAILEAQEAAIERRVAMKVMLDGSSPDDLTRFVAEAKITGQLEHPNVIPVHELSVDENGQPFYTMKMVRGITLRKVLELLAAGLPETVKKYQLPALLTIFQKVCDALAFAHSKGVIHRDLKPENIMLDDFGVVLVMDWGLAKIIGRAEKPATNVARSAVRTLPPDKSGGTLAGTIMGTPQYMSPEQARGEVETLDARSDIYALGAILYHLLALRPPVTGDDAWAIVAKVAEGEIEPLVGTTGPGVRDASTQRGLPHLPGGRVPEGIAAVVRKAMSLDRAQRYPEVADLQRDIEAYQNGRATRAENAGLAKQLVLLVKRHKALFSTALAAWLIITVLAVWFVINLRASERKATHNALIAGQNERKALDEKENTRRALAKSQIALAEAAYQNHDSTAMRTILKQVPADLHDLDWNYLFEKSDMSIATIGQESDYITGVAADPATPGVFAILGRNHRISFIRARTGERLRDFPVEFSAKNPPGNRFMLAFSPKGERIAVGQKDSKAGIAIYNASDGKKLIEWDADPGNQLQFSPDGSQLLLSNLWPTPGYLSLYDASTGKLLWTYSPTEVQSNCNGAAFTADGQRILTYGNLPPFRLLDAKDGTIVRDIKLIPGMAHIMAVAMLPQGNAAIALGAFGEIRGFSLNDGNTLFQNHIDHTEQAYLSLTADGKRFVSVTALDDGRQSIQLWNAFNGKLLETLLGGAGGIEGMSVHPLSGEMLVSGPVNRVWNLASTPPKWTLPEQYNQALFCGSEDLLFTARSNTKAALWDLRVSKPIWQSAEPYYGLASIGANGQFATVRPYDVLERTVPTRVLRLAGEKTESIAEFPPPSTAGYVFGLSPDGSRLLLASGGFRIFNVATRAKETELDMHGLAIHEFHDFGWIARGKQIVGIVTANAARGNANSSEQIVLWDAITGKRLLSVNNPTAMNVLAVSPDGRSFAEAGVDRMVRVRDTATLAVKQEFRAHDGPITVLAFHPNRPILVTGSEDLTVKIWNLETGRTLEEFHSLTGAPTSKSLNFSSSGRRLAWTPSGSGGGVWEPASLNPKPTGQ